MPINPLLAKARSLGNPFEDDGLATFVWQGSSAPRLIDDFHGWDDAPQIMLRSGSNLWTFSFALPKDAYLEYAFLDPRTGERVLDPLNPHRIWNGIEDYNHFFYMPHAAPNPLTQRKEGVRRGKLTRHIVETRDYAIGGHRTVYLYHPPKKGPHPLLTVYDGYDYLRRGKLDIIVDNMIAEKRIRPVALAFVQNAASGRPIEYSCAESTISLLTEYVLPLAQDAMDLEPVKKGNYGILGASLGGSMALFTALRAPHIFRKVLSQSGAFFAPDYKYVVDDLVKYFPKPDIEIWMDVGRLEWLLGGNRKMHALLKKKNYSVKYHEFQAAHNYTAWRNDIWRGLEALYG